MKNLLLPLVAALALTITAAPTFAAGKSGDHQGTHHETASARSGGSYGESCAAILADTSGYTKDQVQACE